MVISWRNLKSSKNVRPCARTWDKNLKREKFHLHQTVNWKYKSLAQVKILQWINRQNQTSQTKWSWGHKIIQIQIFLKKVKLILWEWVQPCTKNNLNQSMANQNCPVVCYPSKWLQVNRLANADRKRCPPAEALQVWVHPPSCRKRHFRSNQTPS